jgi:hypothetical protein
MKALAIVTTGGCIVVIAWLVVGRLSPGALDTALGALLGALAVGVPLLLLMRAVFGRGDGLDFPRERTACRPDVHYHLHVNNADLPRLTGRDVVPYDPANWTSAAPFPAEQLVRKEGEL